MICECGCGQITPIASQTWTKYGVRKGEHLRFVKGHNRRGATFTEEHRQKISQAKKGVPCPESTRAKLKTRPVDPTVVARLNAVRPTSRSIESREKAAAKLRGRARPYVGAAISRAKQGKARPDMVGANHFNWKGGRPHGPRDLSDHRAWSLAVRRRDGFTCQSCGLRCKRIDAHHIMSYTAFPEHRYNIANGITLCRKCHTIAHGWTPAKSASLDYLMGTRELPLFDAT